MKTKQEVLKANCIDIDALQADKPLLFQNILQAMDDYACETLYEVFEPLEDDMLLSDDFENNGEAFFNDMEE